MGRKEDLSVRSVAEASRNRTVLIGITIMNVVLCIAYMMEVVKGVRSLGSYLILAVICIVSTAWGIIEYLRKKDSLLIRFICGLGFLVFYTLIMMTTTSDLAFCYVLVVYCILIVYADVRFSMLIGTYALIVNIFYVVNRAVTQGLAASDVTAAEIMIACIIMTVIFSQLSIYKITKIGKAGIDKAAFEKKQSDDLLDTTLAVADSVTESIKNAMSETEQLNEEIVFTKNSMDNLNKGTQDTTSAIAQQQKNTNAIDLHINEVKISAEQIVEGLSHTEEELNIGKNAMNELLQHVKESERSSELVAREMGDLKDNADKMQDIVALIGSVSKQTSLLALNASIEAARAGEAGKGFAVVADEISGLASQTNTATDNINKLIGNITLSISRVTKAIEELLQSNAVQNECVGRSAQNFDKIHDDANEIAVEAERLKETIVNVSEANKVVIESIDNVSAVTQQVTASATQTLESCNMNLESIEKLTAIMQELSEAVKELKRD